LSKDFQKYKNWHLKTLLGEGAKRQPYLMDEAMGLNLSSPPRRDAFLVRVAPLTLSDVSLGSHCYLKC